MSETNDHNHSRRDDWNSRRQSRGNVNSIDFSRVRFDLEAWLQRAALCADAEQFVRKTVIAPARHLSGVFAPVVQQPDARSGKTDKLESQLEWAGKLTASYRAGAGPYFDQPATVATKAPRGGWTSATFDYLQLQLSPTTDYKGDVVEIGPRSKFAAKIHTGIFEERSGRYFSPVWEEYFRHWGFCFHVVTEDDFEPKYLRSVRTLLPYITGVPAEQLKKEDIEVFVEWVRANPGCKLGEMSIDPVLRSTLMQYLVARQIVFTSISELEFDAIECTRLYPTPQDEAAFHRYLQYARPVPKGLDELGYRLRPDALISIGGVDYVVTRITGKNVHIRSRDKEEENVLTYQALLDLSPKIGRVVGAEETVERLYQTSPVEHRLIWMKRHESIQPYLPGGEKQHEQPKNRTVRFYRDAYVKAERLGGCGDEAIFPRLRNCGRKPMEWDAEVEREFNLLVETQVEAPRASSGQWVYRTLVGKFGLERVPSERNFYRRLASRDKLNRIRKSQGRGGENKLFPFFGDHPLFGSPHGDRAFAKAHVDATPANVKHPADQRQYLVKMVDEFTGKEIAHIQTSVPPSEETTRAIIFDCVERNGALPAVLVFDWGPEHRTTWMQKSLAALGVTIMYRPKKRPRSGGCVESTFSALCAELEHNMPGNLKLTKHGRMLTAAVKPDNFATMSASDMAELHDAYCALRNDIERNGKPSPNALERASFEKFGLPPRQVRDVSKLRELLMPFVRGGDRVVSPRGSIRVGKRTFGVIGEQNPLRQYAGKRVDVRWSPEEPGLVYAYPKDVRTAIRCECVDPTGPSVDLIQRAQQIDAAKPNPVLRKARFCVQAEKKVGEATLPEKAKIVPFQGTAEDEEITPYDFN